MCVGSSASVRRVREFLDEWSKTSSCQRNYWSKQWLFLHQSAWEYVTRLEVIAEILNQPGPSAGNCVENTAKWLRISFTRSYESSRDSISADELDTIDIQDMHRFLTVVGRRAAVVKLDASPAILTFLLSNPYLDHLEVDELDIHQKTRLSDLEFSRLGTMIRQSVQLKRLHLVLSFDTATHEFFDRLAMSTNLQSLRVQEIHEEHTAQFLSNLVVGDDSNGAVARLLRNPENQLRKLDLSDMTLTDCHLIVLARLLPTSRVEELDVSGNKIQAKGILELARQLPRIQSLKEIRIARNPCTSHRYDWNQCPDSGETLLHGIIGNTSLVRIDTMIDVPQANLLIYCLKMNRAGRRILSSACAPDGLLPFVLARTVKYEDACSIVYFFLRKYPRILSSRCSFAANRVRGSR